MGSPAIFSGRRTKLLTADGLLNSNGSINDNDGIKNYIANGHAEVNTSGWSTYADAAGTRPVDGTGGTPTLTFTRSTTAPVSGQASFLLTSPGTVQGQGVSYDFTIDAKDKAKVLQLNFDYLVNSGTFVAGTSSTDSDIIAYIYNIGDAVLLETSSIKLLGNSTALTERFSASFQSSSTSTTYRLILHSASASAAFSIKLGAISISPTSYAYGTPITSWQAYTPTITGFGTPTLVSFFYRRVGDNAEVRGGFTVGTPTATQAQIGLPSGLVTDSSKVYTAAGATNNNIIGVAAYNSGASASYNVVAPVANQSYVNIAIQSASTGGTVPQNGSAIFAASSVATFFFSVPIVGWSSSVQMSDQTDTRVVDFAGYVSANAALTANVTNLPFTAQKDSHGAWTGSTYIVPVAGDYLVAMVAIANAAGSLQVYIDGVMTKQIGSVNASASWTSGSVIIHNLKTGQIVSLRIDTSLTIIGSATVSAASHLSIGRWSGPNQIAATETIAARYTVAAAVSGSPTQPINYATKTFDTHNAVTTGSSWKFTAPAQGIYRLSIVGLSTITGGAFQLFKNGVVYSYLGTTVTANTTTCSGSTLVQLNAGDYIDVRLDSAGSTSAITTVDNVSIERLK